MASFSTNNKLEVFLGPVILVNITDEMSIPLTPIYSTGFHCVDPSRPDLTFGVPLTLVGRVVETEGGGGLRKHIVPFQKEVYTRRDQGWVPFTVKGSDSPFFLALSPH